MTWIRTAASELWGLFVDDWVFALALLAWTGVAFLLPRLGLEAAWRGPVFAAGILAILVVNLAWAARRRG